MAVAFQSNRTIASTSKVYSYALGYLRACLVVLVVAHHAALAYLPYAPPAPASLTAQPRLWQAFPVVDPHKWSGSIQFVGFNDVFFMSLMFFLSGLFVWQGLTRKGPEKFLRDRMARLGLPFLASVLILAPLAYYPSYLQSAGAAGFGSFCRLWVSLRSWPAGPAWFIWVLLAFDTIAACLFVIAPGWGNALGRALSSVSRKPIVMFATLVLISATIYIPMVIVLSPGTWTAWGPFTFQTSRIFHYIAYFLMGVGIGAVGVDRGLVAPEGAIGRRWVLWVVVAVVIFLLASAVTIVALAQNLKSTFWTIAISLGFVFSCAGSSFACLAVSLRFANSRNRLFDSMNAISYAIYLFHYAYVSWFQYALLPSRIAGFTRFTIVFTGALTLSWMTAIGIRRIPAVSRII